MLAIVWFSNGLDHSKTELFTIRKPNFNTFGFRMVGIRAPTVPFFSFSKFQDANLELFPDIKFTLSKLERIHMSGPFGNPVAKYLLRGADSISSISLGIEWLDPAFCLTQPDTRSDFLGKEYLVKTTFIFFL